MAHAVPINTTLWRRTREENAISTKPRSPGVEKFGKTSLKEIATRPDYLGSRTIVRQMVAVRFLIRKV